MARVPTQCPPGFIRYTVVKGDTIFFISRRFQVDIGLILANNPHIPNPQLIFPGDVLCVPATITLPCCSVLRTATPPVNSTAIGVTLAQQLPNSQQAVSILATGLPNPAQLGNFDAYEGFITFPGLGSYGFLLYPTPENPPSWSGMLTIPRPILFRGATVQVRTTNTTIEVSPRVVLQGGLCT